MCSVRLNTVPFESFSDFIIVIVFLSCVYSHRHCELNVPTEGFFSVIPLWSFSPVWMDALMSSKRVIPLKVLL